VQATYITPDTEIIAAEANEALIGAVTGFAKQAAKFQNAQVSPEARRQLDLLRTSLTMSAPPDAREAQELTRLVTSMESVYGRGKYCPTGEDGDACLDIEEITKILAESRDPKQLLDVWAGWHTISIPMKKDYARFVELSNKGAQALGFKDTGAMWRSKYDMPPEAFAKELDRLWEQLRPLYLSLHTYVRSQLREKYGPVVLEKGPIPAHLLGNLWQQDWSNVYPRRRSR
jgi:peptidyl-dipeptidase A